MADGPARAVRRPELWRRGWAAAAVSVALLAGLLWWTGPGALEVLAPGRWLWWPVAGYVLAQLLGGVLRAWRFALLLRADRRTPTPGFAFLWWVTLARNMLVDLVPARAGELAYVLFLNRGPRVSLPACFSSLGLSLVFDILALLLLALLLLAGAPAANLPWGALLVAALLTGLAWAVYLGARHPARWLARRAERSPAPWRARVWRGLSETFASLARIRAAGVFWPVLGLSLGLRGVKYGGLYLLFLAVTWHDWPAFAGAELWQVLTAFVAAEAAASLPVPAFMSFGTYEAGALGAWVALGFPAATAMGVMFAVHLISQAVDYTLGAAGLGGILWSGRRSRR